ncbi:DUF3124 domain-containing protein [Sanyastnella coralliicola]|uniref:DUF3124 domain-containing protein n=1 Tax=Sanyastnella coralliicola TaxID=3069118 RepID=UPI0027BA4BDB|nr:DUF3124 domain-containing protein [Longitalea sp. SCSIO 12813]
MKPWIFALTVITVLFACDNEPHVQFPEENWSDRVATMQNTDSMAHGKTYLSVYSQIYSFSQQRKYNMTGMVSLRNLSESDTVYILRADYFNTVGKNIRSYVKKPVFLAPMETIEIVIAQSDVEGGTGSNFLFEWKTPSGCPEPLFEGVMNSMEGALGASFTTTGKRIE